MNASTSDDCPHGLYGYSCRECSKQRRASNRASSADVLRGRGIEFLTKNNGAHLVLLSSGRPIADLWPGTGKWQVRGRAGYGRGVFNLLRALAP